MSFRVPVLLLFICITFAECKPSSFKFEAFENSKTKNVFHFDRSSNSEGKPQGNPKDNDCGYKSCNSGEKEMLNVHIVPHTHDDVGWLKTVDQYFYGAKTDIQHAGVQYILDTVIQALMDDPNRRFIYVEIAFFHRWWQQQEDYLRHQVKKLVNEGRLEFILGGWCMNDEAATHYNAMIDQHTLGFKFLMENFGECGRPKIGWQIDPFGHSREQASLFAQFGFDGYFFGRLDYQDKDLRLNTSTMESLWMASENLGDQSSLLTGVTYNKYRYPDHFCFDSKRKCDKDFIPIMDDPRLHDYNVEERVNDFIKAAEDQAKHYSTNHIMMTFGSDFQYENAHMNFKNMDKLIKYVNERKSRGSKINVFYSTPSCYLYALNNVGQSYTTKEDDFFPYASRAHTFWTGYFTSRAALKGYVRTTNNFLQVVQQLDVLSQLDVQESSAYKLEILKQAMGVAQHHDAVSGTEKQAVAYDYAMRLANGVRECEDVVNSAYARLLAKGSTTSPVQQFCTLTNVTYCQATERNKDFAITLYNPIGRPVTHWVRLPVTGHAYSVADPEMAPVKTQFIPLSAETKRLPTRNESIAIGEIVFAVNLPPLGFKTYMVAMSSDEKIVSNSRSKITTPTLNQDSVIKNQHISLTFDSQSGMLKSMTNMDKNLQTMMSQNILYYESYAGNNANEKNQSSGAYVFRPNGSEAMPLKTNRAVNTIVQGDQVQEVHQVFSDWASQVVRLYDNANYVEFEWTVGPIPIKDNKGKEVISKFMSDLASNSTFYTDSNGREMLERVRDFRPTWKLNQTESVAGNYYPVNSRIYIQDKAKNMQLTILTDRSQGGASIKDGEIELMVHRRMLHDDSFGVGEPLNETGPDGEGLIVRGKHYVLLDTIADSGRLHRDFAEKLFMAPFASYAPMNVSAQEYAKDFNMEWSGLKAALPDNVHLLTLEQWEGPSFLLRLEHFYEKGEDTTLSQPATISFKDLFAPFEIDNVQELTLGGNQMLDDAKRLVWNIKGGGHTDADMKDFVTPVDPQKQDVILKPMQIRTFQVVLKPTK